MSTTQPQAVLYLRHGIPDPNAVEFDGHRMLLEELAQQEQAQIVGVYEDVGISGISAIHQRPGISALLENAEKGQFDTLYVLDAGRLSRDMEQCLEILQRLRRAGVRIMTPHDGEVKPGPEMLSLWEFYADRAKQIRPGYN